MNAKRLLRGPIPWIILALAIVFIGWSAFQSAGPKSVSTQQGLAFLSSGKVQEATIIDGDQRVDLTLKTADAQYGQKVQFYYVAPRGADVVKAVDDANLAKYDDQVPQQSIWTSLLFTIVPFLIIGRHLLLPALPDAGRRRPRDAVRQEPGEARRQGGAAGDPSPTSRAPTRRSRSSRRSRTSSGSRRSSSPSARRSRRASSSTAPLVPARRSSRGRPPARRACRSSRSRARTSSRCSSASAPRASVTSSSRRRRTRRRSCSSTRSTPSAATAAPASAAGTTSASRR